MSYRLNKAYRDSLNLCGYPQEVTAINFFQDPCRIAFSPETEGLHRLCNSRIPLVVKNFLPEKPFPKQ